MFGKQKNKIRFYNTVSDKILDLTVWIMMILIFAVISVPLIFVVASSFSSTSAVAAGRVLLWPVDFSLDGYTTIFRSPSILRSFMNSVLYTAVGTVISVTLTLCSGYPLSRKDFKARPYVLVLFTITMFFGGGMIPLYLVVNKLKMIDTLWAMVLPGAISVWNVILTKTYIQSSIPVEIYESASIDGCSDIKYFTKMIIPLAKPIIAVMILLYAVGKWNDFFSGLIYLNDASKQPLQLLLRSILVQSDADAMNMSVEDIFKRQELKLLLQYSMIVVSAVPVMILYPFIQKYFVKGIMMGSIKG